MKKGQILATTLISSVALLSLASCGGNSGKKVINFYCSAGNQIVGPIEEKVKAFNESNKDGYQIKIVNPGDYDPLKDKIKADLKVKSQPAIAYCYPDHVAEYLAGSYKDKVIDLQERFIKDDKEFANIKFIDKYYEEGKIFAEGKLYTLPFVKSTEVMYVNTNLLTAAGIQLSELDTWESIFKDGGVADKLKAKYDKKTPIGIDSSDNLFITLCEQYGLPYTQQSDTIEDRYLFNNAKNEKMLKSLNKKVQDGKLTTRGVMGGAYTSTKFVTQDLVMSIGSTGGANHQDPKGAFNYAVLPYPKKENSERVSISQGPSLIMFEQNTDEAENDAWKFIKTLFSDELQTTFSTVSGYMPVTATSYENESFKNFLDKDSIVSKTIKLASSVKDSFFVSPAFDGSNTARQEVGKALDTVLAASKNDNVDQITKDALLNAFKMCTFYK